MQKPVAVVLPFAVLSIVLIVGNFIRVAIAQQGLSLSKVQTTGMTESPLKAAPPMAFVSTTKPDEAKRFYTDVLGLEFVADDKFALIFRIHGNQTLRVQRVHELKPQPFTVFGWQVEDIESSVAILTKLGVMFQMIGLPTQDKTGVCTFDNGDKVAWFKDPDGNTLSIAQLVPN